LVYLLVFHAYINELHGSRSKIPSKKSRPYIQDIKFLALLGTPYIYNISRLRVNNAGEGILVLSTMPHVHQTQHNLETVWLNHTSAQVSNHFLFLFSHYIRYTQSACFKPVHFNTPCQFTSLPNLCSLIFGLTSFGWLHFIMLPLMSDGNIIFHLHLFDLCPLFSNTTRA
jgi:hypothetical protein